MEIHDEIARLGGSRKVIKLIDEDLKSYPLRRDFTREFIEMSCRVLTEERAKLVRIVRNRAKRERRARRGK